MTKGTAVINPKLTTRLDERWPHGMVARRDTRILKNARIYLGSADGQVAKVGWGDIGLEQWHILDRIARGGLLLVAYEATPHPSLNNQNSSVGPDATLETLVPELALALDRVTAVLLNSVAAGRHTLGAVKSPRARPRRDPQLARRPAPRTRRCHVANVAARGMLDGRSVRGLTRCGAHARASGAARVATPVSSTVGCSEEGHRHRPDMTRVPGWNHLDRRRPDAPRPRDYCSDPHGFGHRRDVTFRVVDGGRDVDRQIAQLQHELLLERRAAGGQPPTAVLQERFGISKQVFSRAARGERFLGERILAALMILRREDPRHRVPRLDLAAGDSDEHRKAEART